MSLTSTSSDSDNDFLEMCRTSTLLAELEDDDELPEPDDEMDDNEDDLKDNEEYDDVMVRAGAVLDDAVVCVLCYCYPVR